MISLDRIPKASQVDSQDRQPPKNSPGLTPCLTLLPLATGKKEEKLFAKPDRAAPHVYANKTQGGRKRNEDDGILIN